MELNHEALHELDPGTQKAHHFRLMARLNDNYLKLKAGYLFPEIARRVKAFSEANPDTTVCMESEFPDRPDGLVLFEEATGYTVPQSQQQILDTGLIYTETADGNCDFGEVFTTDGRIGALNLELVDDPGVMILYNVSYTFQNDVYEANADVYDEIVEEILAPLDEEKMAALNAQVDIDAVPYDRVASEYLEEIGLG